MKGEFRHYSDEEQIQIFGDSSTQLVGGFTEETWLAMGYDQAERLGRGSVVCIRPQLPDGKKIYYRLETLPPDLCHVEPGWTIKVTVPRENIEEVMDILYPNGLDEKHWEIISAIEGDVITILGFGD